MTLEALMNLIWPLTLIIFAFIACMFYQLFLFHLIITKLMTKADPEKSNTHVYIRPMINSRIRQKVSNVKNSGNSQFGLIGDFNKNKLKQAYKNEQQHPKRKPKMSKPSSAKIEKEKLSRESHAIQLLPQIYDMTKSVLYDTREVIKMFDQNEGPLKNSTEAYSSTERVLGSSVKTTNPEYTAFLEKQAEIDDELGHLQRRLQYEFSVRVVTPLSGWLHTDFARKNAETKKMFEKKTNYDLITAEIARDPRDARLLLQQDLCRREYERQMEITKLELLRHSEIRNEHAKILSQFALAWKEYTAAARRLFDQLDSTLSKQLCDARIVTTTCDDETADFKLECCRFEHSLECIQFDKLQKEQKIQKEKESQSFSPDNLSNEKNPGSLEEFQDCISNRNAHGSHSTNALNSIPGEEIKDDVDVSKEIAPLLKKDSLCRITPTDDFNEPQPPAASPEKPLKDASNTNSDSNISTSTQTYASILILIGLIIWIFIFIILLLHGNGFNLMLYSPMINRFTRNSSRQKLSKFKAETFDCNGVINAGRDSNNKSFINSNSTHPKENPPGKKK